MPQVQRVASLSSQRVLIADDQSDILDALKILLSARGFATKAVAHPAHLLRALEAEHYDAVLMDLNYTRGTAEGSEGLDLVSRIRAIDALVPVIVLTAWSSVDLAVEAMHRGASDFVQKPWDNRDLLHKLETQLSRARAQRREQQLHEDELEEARKIQDRLLPKQLPPVNGYDIAAMTQPLRVVGGDYYSIVKVSNDQTAFCIADVAGKGMPAALLMSSLHAATQPLINQNLAPAELCERLNRILCELTPLGKFISLFYGVLDTSTHKISFCNAGHNPPLLVRADGANQELASTGAVLGQFPRWNYEQSEMKLKMGDTLLLFTDGFVEAPNAHDEPFEEQNLIRVASENRDASADTLLRALVHAASQHTGNHFQDDASLIVVKTTIQEFSS
jgi:sigma-B regulation protein RsbU (phosphoserine phosphatase)